MHSTQDIWRQLVRASVDRRHPWRVVALCTQGADGPSARSVVLRKVLPDARRVTFYTDVRTAKLHDIAQCSRVALLLWDPQHRQQLRAMGQAFIEPDSAMVEQHWATVSEAARRDYATQLPPGTPYSAEGPSGVDFNLALARDHFVVLNVEIVEMDLLQLDRTQHQRNRHVWRSAAGCWEAEPLVP
jgi:hypothetical protein